MNQRSESLRQWLPLICGATAYFTLIAKIPSLLRDADTYWHIAVGQWIVGHRAIPHFDMLSFTKVGEPWITSAWLSEVLYYASFKLAGWPGPAILAALATAAAFFLLALFLLQRLPVVPVMLLVSAGIVMTTDRVLARPHVLVYPLMVLWVNELLRATEERRAPSLRYLPVITLWANLHGSFTLGLILIALFAIEALLTPDKSGRLIVAWQWLRFAMLALLAACITPYGPESILVTFRILDLGAVLSLIKEWRPLDFGSPNPVTVCVLAGAAYALYSGLKLPLLRIAALLALIYQTFAHVRYIDVSALIAPFFVARPLSTHLKSNPSAQIAFPSRRAFTAAIATVILVTGVISFSKTHAPPDTPRAAVEKLRELKATRVMNDYPFGGYLIFEGIPTFIDSRAELYGAFIVRFTRAIWLEDIPDFLKLLDEQKIDATLLSPSTQAVGLLDRLPGWERVYSDKIAVIHVRRAH